MPQGTGKNRQLYLTYKIEMTPKDISIRGDIYNALGELKRVGESWSDVLERLLKGRRKDPLAHFGIGKNVSEAETLEFENAINDVRRGSNSTVRGNSKKWGRI